MKRHTTGERLKQIMEIKNLRQVDILDAAKPFCNKYDVKLNKNDLSQYVSGKTEPGQEKLTILGMALGVSEAWLMGFEVPMERTPVTESGNERLVEFVDLFGLLSPEQQTLIINQIKGILANQ